jgi:hypothetical protein
MRLEYTRNVTRPPGEAWLRLTLACSVVPCCAGLLIFLLWLKTRLEVFPVLGMFTILAGLCLIPIASFSAGRYVRACGTAGTEPRLHYLRFANVLIVLNVFLAIALAVAAYQITTRITVIVTNKSDAPLDQVTIESPSSDTVIGPIAPGQSVRRTLRVTNDGTVSFTLKRDGTNVPIPKDVYVDPFHNNGRIHLRATNAGFLLN